MNDANSSADRSQSPATAGNDLYESWARGCPVAAAVLDLATGTAEMIPADEFEAEAAELLA